MTGRCDFAECDARATTDRGQLRLCADHAAEHDEFDTQAGVDIPTCGAAEQAILDDAAEATRVLLELDGAAATDAARLAERVAVGTRAFETWAVCPRCAAAAYLPMMRTLVDLPPSPYVDHLAHAVGFGIGALRLILERAHVPCAQHAEPATPAAEEG